MGQQTTTTPTFLDQLDVRGSFRTVYSATETKDRLGDRSRSSNLASRLLIGSSWELNPEHSFTARAALRVSTDQGNFAFRYKSETGGSGTYPSGTITLDELHWGWRISPDLLIRTGRFQARFALAGFIPKGMDRYYSANLSIGFTDGVWARWDMSDSWRVHGVVSYNSPSGSSHAGRRPLDYSNASSRVSGLVNLQHRDTAGLWVQRELSLSITPGIVSRGDNSYPLITGTGRGSIRLPLNLSTGDYWFGVEIGYTPLSPTPEDTGVLIEESETLFNRGSLAWQLSLYANDLFDKHTLGVLYGQTDPGWLVSSSFDPNNTLLEGRYRLQISSSLNFEARYRIRTDLYKPNPKESTRRRDDFYARFTYRF